MMVWTHQLPCCECFLLLSVCNSYLFPSSSSMPRLLACRQLYIFSNRYFMVVLKTCDEDMFVISVMPSEIRRFKFTMSRLCDDHTEADSLRRKAFSTTRFDSSFSALSKDKSFDRLAKCRLPPASSLAIRGCGRLSVQRAENAQNVPFPIFSARRFLVWKRRTPLLFNDSHRSKLSPLLFNDSHRSELN
jgi:hypothetical protein